MLNYLRQFVDDEHGLEIAEKAAILVLVITLAVGALIALAPHVKANFTKSKNEIDDAVNFTL